MRRRFASVALVVLAAGCHYSALDRASPEADRITGLHWLMFWMLGGVFAAVIGLLAAALARRLESETERGERLRGRSVVAGAAVASLLLLVLLVASVSAGRQIATPPGPGALAIQVTGHQWWWEVRYPASSPNADVTTANEIHVPVGRPVLLQLSSGDVIHSFWVPNVHGKKDLIPGRPTTHVFRVNRAGTYSGRCAEFCGLQHAHMGLLLIAEEPSRFEAWLAGQRQPAAEPTDSTRQHGRQVFLSSPCILCHTIRGAGAFGHKGPDLTHLASRATIAAATLPNTRGHLAGWVIDAQHIKPGNRMPPNVLASRDLLDLVSYLETLK